MENSVQKLIERIAQIAEKYDVVSRCVAEIRDVKKEYVTEGPVRYDILKIDTSTWRGVLGSVPVELSENKE